MDHSLRNDLDMSTTDQRNW